MVVAIAGVFVFFRHGRGTRSQINPEVLNVRASEATIVWLSGENYKGRVFYQSAGNEQTPLSAIEAFGSSGQHEVKLTGLRPSTRYTYRIDGSKSRFQFQTQPAANSPFSFLIVWGDVSGRIVPLMRSELGEFIVSLTDVPGQNHDWFSDVRPYVPVYCLSGVDLPFLDATGSGCQDSLGNLWKLDWGGLRLIFVGRETNIAKIGELLDASAAHTIGVITSLCVVGEFGSKTISETPLHSILAIHNKQHPTRYVAFVAVIAGELKI